MSEPTIDEMLEWLGQFYVPHEPSYDYRMENAIRAILEQHRNGFLPSIRSEAKRWAQQLRREFVERVEHRIDSALPFVEFADLMREELAAMEKENEPASISTD